MGSKLQWKREHGRDIQWTVNEEGERSKFALNAPHGAVYLANMWRIYKRDIALPQMMPIYPSLTGTNSVYLTTDVNGISYPSLADC